MIQPVEPVNNDRVTARLRVLEMIDEGVITAEEGLRLLQTFSAADAEAEVVGPPVEQAPPFPEAAPPSSGETEIPLPGDGLPDELPMEAVAQYQLTEPTDRAIPRPVISTMGASPAGLPEEARKWKRWWMVPLWIGGAITVFGGFFMYLAQRSSGIGFWFICASLPFALGLLVILLGWDSRNAPWLHLRVQQPPGEKPEKIAFSLPLPVRPAAWFLRTFSRWIPGLKEHSWDDVILAVGDKTSPENPLYIVVDKDETGEKVEIYIG